MTPVVDSYARRAFELMRYIRNKERTGIAY